MTGEILRICLFALFLCGGCTSLEAPPTPYVQPFVEGGEVTVADLLAAPRRYDGKRVRVTAVARIEFEGNALYASRDALARQDATKAVWLAVDWPVSAEIRALDGHSIVVEGRFVTTVTGHFGAYRGAVVDITRCERSN